jgi:hypothetical protein
VETFGEVFFSRMIPSRQEAKYARGESRTIHGAGVNGRRNPFDDQLGVVGVGPACPILTPHGRQREPVRNIPGGFG